MPRNRRNSKAPKRRGPTTPHVHKEGDCTFRNDDGLMTCADLAKCETCQYCSEHCLEHTRMASGASYAVGPRLAATFDLKKVGVVSNSFAGIETERRAA
jgi:hypothetical protein